MVKNVHWLRIYHFDCMQNGPSQNDESDNKRPIQHSTTKIAQCHNQSYYITMLLLGDCGIDFQSTDDKNVYSGKMSKFCMIRLCFWTYFVTPQTSTVLIVNQCRLDVRLYFFINRVLKVWNSLPARPEHFATLSSFQHYLKYVDFGTHLLRS